MEDNPDSTAVVRVLSTEGSKDEQKTVMNSRSLTPQEVDERAKFLGMPHPERREVLKRKYGDAFTALEKK